MKKKFASTSSDHQLKREKDDVKSQTLLIHGMIGSERFNRGDQMYDDFLNDNLGFFIKLLDKLYHANLSKMEIVFPHSILRRPTAETGENADKEVANAKFCITDDEASLFCYKFLEMFSLQDYQACFTELETILSKNGHTFGNGIAASDNDDNNSDPVIYLVFYAFCLYWWSVCKRHGLGCLVNPKDEQNALCICCHIYGTLFLRTLHNDDINELVQMVCSRSYLLRLLQSQFTFCCCCRHFQRL